MTFAIVFPHSHIAVFATWNARRHVLELDHGHDDITPQPLESNMEAILRTYPTATVTQVSDAAAHCNDPDAEVNLYA